MMLRVLVRGDPAHVSGQLAIFNQIKIQKEKWAACKTVK